MMLTADADTNAGRSVLPPPPSKRHKVPDLRTHFTTAPDHKEASQPATLEYEVKILQEDFTTHWKCVKKMLFLKKKTGRAGGSPRAAMFDLRASFAPSSVAVKWEKASRDGVGVSHFYGFAAYDVFTTFMQTSIKGTRPNAAFFGNDKSVSAEQRSFYEVIPTTSPCKLYFDVEARMDHKITNDEQQRVILELLVCVRATAEELGLNIPESNMGDVVIVAANRFKNGAWKLSYHFVFHSIFFDKYEDFCRSDGPCCYQAWCGTG